jgi:hypothetical protein
VEFAPEGQPVYNTICTAEFMYVQILAPIQIYKLFFLSANNKLNMPLYVMATTKMRALGLPLPGQRLYQYFFANRLPLPGNAVSIFFTNRLPLPGNVDINFSTNRLPLAGQCHYQFFLQIDCRCQADLKIQTQTIISNLCRLCY